MRCRPWMRVVAIPGLTLALALALGLALAPAWGGSAVLPPVADPPTHEYHPGKFVWIDLVTPDIAGAQRFYGGLFGWTFRETGTRRGPAGYSLAYLGETPVAGLAQRAPAPSQARAARWIAYASVADVGHAVARVEAAGGRTLIPARLVAGRGTMALVADPDGAPFGLIHAEGGDPPDYLAGTGDWVWALYQSPDASRAAAFYQDLAGYEVLQDDRFPGTPDFLLAAGGYVRASVVEIPAARGSLRPDWLYFVRVADVGAAISRAVALGGRVIVAADPAVAAGRIAVLADPAGGAFGLLEWNIDVAR